MTTSPVPRPALAFRVGVTGARALDAAAVAALRPRVRDVLRAVQARLEALAAEVRARAAYGPPPPRLRLLSPLAEGTDRLVAEEALALGYELEAVLPFDRATYAADFPSSRHAFDALLTQAGPRVLELDGARGEHEARSYEAVGRAVARNCDLLIAVWDGLPGKGRGGTADTVRFAARFGPPIWLLGVNGGAEPVWITEARELRHRDLARQGAEAVQALNGYLAGAVLPPAVPPRHPHGVVGRLTQWLRHRLSPEASPLDDYLDEAPGATAPQEPGGASPVQAYWRRLYGPPDRLAIGYARRYRHSYTVVFYLAAAALSFAVLGVALHHRAVTLLELVAVLGILGVVLANEWRRWHERLITYRLLAELCRKQQALALLGWSLPLAEVTRASGGTRSVDGRIREAWVGWYFNAALRAAPLRAGVLDAAARYEVRDALRRTLVAGQAAYHADRVLAARRRAGRLGSAGEWLFLVTVGVVLLELSPAAHALPVASPVLGLIAALLPALSAAFVAIRGYAEPELVAEQSERMTAVMRRAEARLETQPLDAPLASQELGEEVSDLVGDMLRDLTGWTQLFRVKAVEAS